MLPFILKRAMILATVCLVAASIIAFGASVLSNQNDNTPKIRVGYTAKESRIMDLAVAYVQNMESVKSICSLEAVAEQEGIQLLEQGELSALIVLPDDVINEILSGSNTPAVLYLPPNDTNEMSDDGLYAVSNMLFKKSISFFKKSISLFEELASAGMGMLGTAQAEIYASTAILQELSKEYELDNAVFTEGVLQAMYDEINRFNLETVAGREKLFRTKTLSLTENDTYAVYYGSALFTIYVMLAGLFLGKFCKQSDLQQMMAARRIGVGYGMQLVARCLAGSLLMFVVLLLPFGLFFIPQVRDVLSVTMSFAGIVSLFLMILFITLYNMVLYQIIEKRESALVVVGVLTILQAYLAGCMIPSVLLPRAVASVGKFLPAAMIKKGFTILFTGQQEVWYVVEGLLGWGVVLFLISVLDMRMRERSRSSARARRMRPKIHVPLLSTVMLRRLLHKKSIWLSLGFIVVLSAVIVKTEKNSETQIKAAVYDASGDYKEVLSAYSGLVQFTLYANDEEVQRAVQRGDVACGYVFPKTLLEDMLAQNADREILVYQDADAVAVSVVNEILFEQIFRQVSLKWFEGHLAQHSILRELGVDKSLLEKIAEDNFNKEIISGSTFRFTVRRVNAKDVDTQPPEENRTTYPIYGVAVLAVVLCTLQGIVQVIVDVKEYRFYKQNRVFASALTLILPMMLGILCACLILH